MSRKNRTAGDYLHRRMIRLRCDRCKRTMLARRLEIDPPTAATLVYPCGNCQTDGESYDQTYLDSNGVEVSGDPETWQCPLSAGTEGVQR